MNNVIPENLRKELARDPFYTKCCYKGCGKPPQWHHVWLYGGKQVQEGWSILPACETHHKRATPHNNSYQQEVREYFEWLSLTRAQYGDLAKYPKAAWPERINYLSKQAQKFNWKI